MYKKSWPVPGLNHDLSQDIATRVKTLTLTAKMETHWASLQRIRPETFWPIIWFFDYLIIYLQTIMTFYFISSETQLWHLQKLLCLWGELNNCDSYSNKIKVFRCCQKKQKVDQICLRYVTSWKLTQVIQCWFIQKEFFLKESFPVIQNFVQRRKCRPSSCLKENTRAAT